MDWGPGRTRWLMNEMELFSSIFLLPVPDLPRRRILLFSGSFGSVYGGVDIKRGWYVSVFGLRVWDILFFFRVEHPFLNPDCVYRIRLICPFFGVDPYPRNILFTVGKDNWGHQRRFSIRSIEVDPYGSQIYEVNLCQGPSNVNWVTFSYGVTPNFRLVLINNNNNNST